MKTLNNIIDENKNIYNTNKKKNNEEYEYKTMNTLRQEYYIDYVYCEMVLI